MNSKKLFSITLICETVKNDDLNLIRYDVANFLQMLAEITKLSPTEVERIYSNSLRPEGVTFSVVLEEEKADLLSACFSGTSIVVSHKIRTMCANVRNSSDKIVNFVSNTSAIVSEYAHMVVENDQLRREMRILKAHNKELEANTKKVGSISEKLTQAKEELDATFKKLKEVEKLLNL